MFCAQTRPGIKAWPPSWTTGWSGLKTPWLMMPLMHPPLMILTTLSEVNYWPVLKLKVHLQKCKSGFKTSKYAQHILWNFSGVKCGWSLPGVSAMSQRNGPLVKQSGLRISTDLILRVQVVYVLGLFLVGKHRKKVWHGFDVLDLLSTLKWDCDLWRKIGKLEQWSWNIEQKVGPEFAGKNPGQYQVCQPMAVVNIINYQMSSKL